MRSGGAGPRRAVAGGRSRLRARPDPAAADVGRGVRYARLSQLLLALARAAWHLETLWLPQAHAAARQRTGVPWAQRAALGAFLGGWQSYLQVRAAPRRWRSPPPPPAAPA